jgi:hypothetical protein
MLEVVVRLVYRTGVLVLADGGSRHVFGMFT